MNPSVRMLSIRTDITVGARGAQGFGTLRAGSQWRRDTVPWTASSPKASCARSTYNRKAVANFPADPQRLARLSPLLDGFMTRERCPGALHHRYVDHFPVHFDRALIAAGGGLERGDHFARPLHIFR